MLINQSYIILRFFQPFFSTYSSFFLFWSIVNLSYMSILDVAVWWIDIHQSSELWCVGCTYYFCLMTIALCVIQLCLFSFHFAILISRSLMFLFFIFIHSEADSEELFLLINDFITKTEAHKKNFALLVSIPFQIGEKEVIMPPTLLSFILYEDSTLE